MNKKGGISDVFGIAATLVVIGIIGFVVVVISAVWLQGFGNITDRLTNLPNQNNITNVSLQGERTFGNLNTAFQQLRWISIMIIFGMVIGVFISALLVRAHPAWFAMYFVLVVIAVLFSIFIANTYETLYESGGTFGNELQTFVGASWLLLYLPVWVTAIALLGGIVIFFAVSRDSEQGSIA